MRRVMGVLSVVVGCLAAVPGAQGAVTIGPATQTVPESGSVSFTVSRSAVGALGSTADVPVTVTLGKAGDTASCPADVSPCAVTIPVSGGLLTPTSGAAQFTVIADTLNEVNESITATVTSAPGDTIGSPSSSVATITDDDPLPTLSVGAGAVTEGTHAEPTTLALPVTLSAASGRAVSVAYDLTPGTAGPDDATLTGGTVSIPAGQTGGMILVPIVADAIDEGGPEAFTATLHDPVNATLTADKTATATIDDDDVARLSIADVGGLEGAAGAITPFVFTVTLSTPAARAITVPYATSDMSAVAPGDYTAATGSLLFAAGDTAKTFTVNVNGDPAIEPNEAFGVSLGATSGAPLARAAALGGILNDDAPVVVATPPAGAGGTGGSGPVVPSDTTAPKGKLTKFTLAKPGTLRSTFTCPATEIGCKATITVFTVAAPRGKVKRLRTELKLVGKTVTVAGGKRASLHLKIPAKSLKLLRQARRTEVRGYAVVRDAAGNVGTAKASGVLRF